MMEKQRGSTTLFSLVIVTGPMQKSDLTTNPRLTIGLPSILLARFHVKTELCDLQWDLFAFTNRVNPDEKGQDKTLFEYLTVRKRRSKEPSGDV